MRVADQNNCGCSEAEQFGSIGGHVRQDAEATADLLFDSIKVDGCGPSQNISEWAAELNATGRPILIEDCLTKRYTKKGLPSPVPLAEIFETCPGNFFRLGQDIGPQFVSAEPLPLRVVFLAREAGAHAAARHDVQSDPDIHDHGAVPDPRAPSLTDPSGDES